MSLQTQRVPQSFMRYTVEIQHFMLEGVAYYEMIVRDSAIKRQKVLFFRFSQLLKVHEEIGCKYMKDGKKLPQFPRRNSFLFWNKTNGDPALIRQREVEFKVYFAFLLNLPEFCDINVVSKILRRFTIEANKSQSMHIKTRMSQFNFEKPPERHPLQISQSKSMHISTRIELFSLASK